MNVKHQFSDRRYVLTLFLLFQIPRVAYFFFAPGESFFWSSLMPLTRGWLFDLVTLLVPWALISFSLSFFSRVPGVRAISRHLAMLLTAISIAFITFSVFTEVLFIQEFHARFNFIAVDYLIYTSELTKNAWESYPMTAILSGLAALTFGFTWWIFKNPEFKNFSIRSSNRSMRTPLLLILLAALGLFFTEEQKIIGSLDEPSQELSKNTIYTWLAAYRHNEIDYDRFYSTLPSEEAEALVTQLTQKSHDQGSTIKPTTPPHTQPINVVLILMESMSAKFMGTFGYTKNITPQLDQLFQQSLSFDQVFATGTRTVRGIEAVSLSIPPTPGQSMVRRPLGGQVESLGSVLAQHHYKTQFLYGGYAYFDNMRSFFEEQGHQIIDHSSFSQKQIHFENAWGICDEDVFDRALEEQQNLVETLHKPFFQFILTTSNHRPYTFPDGRIPLPSGAGRDEAVMYSDYAVGDFIRKAKEKSWFKNTIFVFVADHNASVAGGTKILPEDYRIPVILHAPYLLPKKIVSTLGSQLDLAPTLLKILGYEVPSTFFGHDLLSTTQERAFLGTYQKLAYIDKNHMVILEPNRKNTGYGLHWLSPHQIEIQQEKAPDLEGLKTAIAFYQTSSRWFKQGRLFRKTSAATAIPHP